MSAWGLRKGIARWGCSAAGGGELEGPWVRFRSALPFEDGEGHYTWTPRRPWAPPEGRQ